MLLSTQTEDLGATFGDCRAVELLAKAGFDAFDYSMFSMSREGSPLSGKGYLEHVRQVKRAAEDCGIACNQAHAPFPSHIAGDEAYNERILPCLARAIEITAELGGKIVVVHPDNDLNAEQNADFYRKLLPYAEACKVKIAAENMWNWPKGSPHATPAACSKAADFAAHVNAVKSPYLAACLDIGHAFMEGPADPFPDMVRALGPALQALHVHDNDLLHDSHTAPFSGRIDWELVTATLAENGYCGDFTFEADSFLMQYPPELKLGAARLLCAIGRHLITKIKAK